MNARTPLFELRDARVVRDGRVALDIESLALYEGEHVAVLGPNGAGKSTLIETLVREVRPIHRDAPPVRLLGRERWDLFEARALFGVVSERLQLANERDVSVRDAVLSGFFGSVGIPPHRTVTQAQVRSAGGLMRRLGVDHLADRPMNRLSTGEARRVLIARALVHDPAVLVLDEPCDGLDPHATSEVLSAVSDLAGEGRSLLLVTHHVEDIVPEVERVLMLREGRLVADGPKERLLTSARLSELFDMTVRVERRDGVFRLW